MGARQCLTPLYSCESEAGWVATKVKRGVGRGLLISTRNQMSLALTKAGFWSSNSCLYRERQDFFPDIARRKEGEDGRLCTTKQEDKMWTFRRSLGKGWGEEKRLPCLGWRFAHGRHWRGWRVAFEGMFQNPFGSCRDFSDNTGALIWCQTGGRNKIYTYQSDVSNSLAIHPSTP